MKKAIFVVLWINAFLLVGRFWHDLDVEAQVEQCVTKNGDVNADGHIDTSDAVDILGHIFHADPAELLPICDSNSLCCAELLDEITALRADVSANKPAWPPPPELIVNVVFGVVFPAPGQPRSPVTVFTVPEDKWLIVTDIDITTLNTTGTLRWNLLEDAGGELTAKRSTVSGNHPVQSFTSTVGIPFSPGSKVVANGLSTGPSVSFTLVGYLTDG